MSYYKKTGQYRAKFDNDHCECDFCTSMNKQKKTKISLITSKVIQRTNQAKQMKEAEFIKLIHFRNGVEGIPSILRRKYNVDRIPFRGSVRKKHSLGIKCMAINAKKAIKYQQDRDKVA